MKKMTKRILALILCFTIVFGPKILVFADQEEIAAETEGDCSITEASEATVVAETETEEELPEEPTAEPTPESIVEPTVEPVAEPTETPEVLTEEMTEDVVEATEETEEVVTTETIVANEETKDDTLVEEATEETVEEAVAFLTEEKPVITRYDYKSDEVHVLVTLTDPADLPDAAELVVTPIILEEEVESDVCVEAKNDNIILKEIHAFDIKFMLDGEEVQPGETVKVKISLPGMDMDKDTAVYHIDENNNIENMDGEVNRKGDVVFETPHFSTYVVVPTVNENNIDTISYSNRASLNSSTSGNASGEGLIVNKTAQVDDWDERTYDITITAQADYQSTETVRRVSDGMMVMDISGSMLWSMTSTGYSSASAKSIGNYCDIKDDPKKLDPSKVYIIGASGQRPFVYLDYPGEVQDGWYYYEDTVNVSAYWNGGKDNSVTPIPGRVYDDSKWTKIPDTSNWTIFDWSAHRVTTLKQLIRSYMESAASVSPESYLGMTAFYHKGYNVFNPMPVASNGVANVEMIKRVAAMFPQKEWCTYPNTGLELAFKGMVSANSSYNDAGTGSINIGTLNDIFNRKVDGYEVGKYLILFSDGEPDGLATDATTDAAQIAQIEKETKAWANAFKEKGVTIYTVAFAYNSSDSSWLTDIASEGCVYNADTMEQLKAALEDIQEKETTTVVEEIPVDVTDYIDPRFVILDNAGNPIGVDYPGIADGITVTTTGYDGDTPVTRNGKVYYDENGQQYIVWDNTKAVKAGSSWTVKVQAQEDYIGGNDVTTNISPDSKISTDGYGDFVLPNPHVNVKAVMDIGNNQAVLYKGTNTPTGHATSSDPLAMLYNAEAKIEEYLAPGYEGVDSSDFVLKWYTDATCTTEISLEDIASSVLNEETNYYLRFTYNPGAIAEGSDANANTTKDGVTYIAGRNEDEGNAGTDAGLVEAISTDGNPYGIYNIKLWQIVKRSASDTTLPLSGVEFELANGTDTYYGKSDAEGFVTLYTNKARTTLATDTPVGEFTFTETKTVDGYQLSDETWTMTITLTEGVTAISSSKGGSVRQENPTPNGVIVSYVYLNDVAVYELPSTGGNGITFFVLAGTGLMVMAVAFLFVSRRRMFAK